ncbi:MAG TPA: DUF2779 domain-containing protein [Bacteroidia bacterium]|nr:DUF2779 domain-containing protein [Bacteroidia bacterium]HRH08161.1 DUF2779 domain-containing protein [Bacteroidia bacterium]
MSNKQRYLTKSRFKLALECPTKLFYTGKEEYPDAKLDDEFLAALAKGGFQVGELAKCYFPGGNDIDDLSIDISLSRTNELLKQENVIIYEAAFKYQNLFIRVDVVVKKGNNLKVYEVKAKSFDSTKDSLTNKNGITGEWKPYVYDITFQKYVIQNSFPSFSVSAYLLLADKSKRASINGLNQKFFLQKDDKGRTKVNIIGSVAKPDLGDEILTSIIVDEIADSILNDKRFSDRPDKSFIEWIHFFANEYEKDRLIQEALGAHCASCEFKTMSEEENSDKKSGFKECWKRIAKFSNSDFDKPSVLEIWDFRKKEEYIAAGKYFQEQLQRSDLEGKSVKASVKGGLSRVDRQELQIEKSKSKNTEAYIDIDGLRAELNSWKFPLHFIDFETTSVAIPFNLGRRPYEQIAFQFSHHLVSADGTIEHKGQWINSEQGKFPNFDFLRALKAELGNDNGTILRYAAHENSILNAVYRQLRESLETDREELCSWIQALTKSTGSSNDKWEGKRNMVDMLELVKSYYYDPATKGSNSIKDVLPAILNSSTYLKNKYSQPIYGRDIKSLNFKNYTWIIMEGGRVKNPYRLLEPIFKGVDPELLDKLVLDDDADLHDGGAAMTAYAQMQFTKMSTEERSLIQKALLKYCELDTLAMVMIWEEWNHLIHNAR